MHFKRLLFYLLNLFFIFLIYGKLINDESYQEQIYITGKNLTTSAQLLVSINFKRNEYKVESPHPYSNNVRYYSTNIILGSGNYLISFDNLTQTQRYHDYLNIHQVGTGKILKTYHGWVGYNFPLKTTLISTT